MMETQMILALQDQAASDSLGEFLRQHGYHLVGRSTAAAVFDLLSRCSVQLLILETRLNDGSGFDVCREIRRRGYHQPILMLAYQEDETDKVLALEMGADDCVGKPYSQREVLARIRALLRRAYGEFAQSGSGQLCLGDLIIDRLRGQVWSAGRLVWLTPIEFRLLTHFAQHPNQVLSRAQIIDAVWGCDIDVNSERVVNTHICRLRGKIEANASASVEIQTVSGFGYRLETQISLPGTDQRESVPKGSLMLPGSPQ